MLTGKGLEAAVRGVHTAYYMIHAMFGGDDYARLDRETARRFAAAARKAGVGHIIYLGGLIPQAAASEHLTSRAEVGAILAEAVPTTELRAGPIVGSGSTSFEMVRYLTERLPLMIVPSWIDHEVQPISIRDTLSYLTLALDLPPLGVMDIGADRITFRGMVETYAELRGLRRVFWTVPALLPRLAARCGRSLPYPTRWRCRSSKAWCSPRSPTRAGRRRFPGWRLITAPRSSGLSA